MEYAHQAVLRASQINKRVTAVWPLRLRADARAGGLSRRPRVAAVTSGAMPALQSIAFRIPVAMTARAWSECVAWPETESLCQDESGRLWDVVFMAAAAARRAPRRGEGDRTTFDLHVVPRGERVPRLTTLVLHVGPGDRGEAVATRMRPGKTDPLWEAVRARNAPDMLPTYLVTSVGHFRRNTKRSKGLSLQGFRKIVSILVSQPH